MDIEICSKLTPSFIRLKATLCKASSFPYVMVRQTISPLVRSHVRSMSSKFREEIRKIGHDRYQEYLKEYLKQTPAERRVERSRNILNDLHISKQEQPDLQEKLLNSNTTQEEGELTRDELFKYRYKLGIYRNNPSLEHQKDKKANSLLMSRSFLLIP